MADVVELRGTPFPESARDAVSALFVAHHRRLVGLASLLVDDMRRVFVEKGFPGVIANTAIDLATSRIARFRQ